MRADVLREAMYAGKTTAELVAQYKDAKSELEKRFGRGWEKRLGVKGPVKS